MHKLIWIFIGADYFYLADDENGLFIIEKYPMSW